MQASEMELRQALIDLNACVIRGKFYDLQLDIRLPLSCGFLQYFDAIG